MSIFRFTKTDKKGKKTFAKKVKNSFFRYCGYVMILSLLVVFLHKLKILFSSWETATYWGEALALIAFGISWLVKGNILSGLHIVKEED